MNNNLSGKPMDGQARQVRDLDRVDDDVGDCNMKSGDFSADKATDSQQQQQ